MVLNRNNMNIFDIITIIVVVVALFFGWRNGFVSQLFSIAGVVGGIVVALLYDQQVGELLRLDPKYAKIVGFIVTFIAVAILVAILSRLLSSILSAIGLGGINTILGIAVSILKYLLILSVVFVLFEQLNNKVEIVSKQYIDNSISFKPVSALSESVVKWFDSLDKDCN